MRWRCPYPSSLRREAASWESRCIPESGRLSKPADDPMGPNPIKSTRSFMSKWRMNRAARKSSLRLTFCQLCSCAMHIICIWVLFFYVTLILQYQVLVWCICVWMYEYFIISTDVRHSSFDTTRKQTHDLFLGRVTWKRCQGPNPFSQFDSILLQFAILKCMHTCRPTWHRSSERGLKIHLSIGSYHL